MEAFKFLHPNKDPVSSVDRITKFNFTFPTRTRFRGDTISDKRPRELRVRRGEKGGPNALGEFSAP